MGSAECSPEQQDTRRVGDSIAAGKSQRDRLFFIVYAGLLLFAFFWSTFPHVRGRVSDPALLRGVLAAGLIYVGLRAFFVLTRREPGRWDALWVSLDLLLITAVVRLSGGINSDAALMYILPVATYSIQRRFTGTLIVGALASLLYGLASYPADPSLDYLGRLVTRLVVLVLMTLLAACYAHHERARVEELAALRAEVALGNYRRELSSEIHDGIQHYLVSMAMRLEIANRVARTDLARAAAMAIDQRVVLRQAAGELRYLVRRLRAPALEHHGFVEATRDHLDMFRERCGTEVALHVVGTPVMLPADSEHAAFRIIQESLTNIEKHAQATHVDLTLAFSTDGLRCTISDNGVGFDRSKLREEPDLEGGFGLSTMRQRAEQADGQLEIDSAPGRGTCVCLTLPMKPAPPDHRQPETTSARVSDAGDQDELAARRG